MQLCVPTAGSLQTNALQLLTASEARSLTPFATSEQQTLIDSAGTHSHTHKAGVEPSNGHD